MTAKRFGAQSMTAPLLEALVKRPGPSFGRAFENPAHGFLHPVDLDEARHQHDALCAILAGLGVAIHELDAETESPDLVYTFDIGLVTDAGAIPLRSGKPTRRGEEAEFERWALAHGIPEQAHIVAPGTVDGGDTFWLRPDLFCIGRSLRTNRAGADQLSRAIGGEVVVFDVPYWHGDEELLHLLSVVSPVADDLAVAFLPLLPAGLHELMIKAGMALVEVPEEEFPTLGCNVLAVRPGVVVMVEGNPRTARSLADRGCEVHTFPGSEICLNGSGGPTCLTRPILRA